MNGHNGGGRQEFDGEIGLFCFGSEGQTSQFLPVTKSSRP